MLLRRPLLTAIVAMAVMSAMDALIKVMTLTVPLGQIVMLRYLFGLVFALPFAWAALRHGIPRGSLAANFARGVLIAFTAAMFFFALSRLPLIETVTLAFTAPIWVIVVARIVLGEPVSPTASVAVALGFCGILVVYFADGGNGAGPRDVVGTIAALTAAITYALSIVLIRRQSSRDPVSLMVLLQTVAALTVTAPLGIWQWTPLTTGALAAFVAIGAMGTVGYLLLATSLSRAPAGDLAPAEYTTLIWALIFGFLVFGERPDLAHILGASLIVAGCAIAARARLRPAAASVLAPEAPHG